MKYSRVRPQTSGNIANAAKMTNWIFISQWVRCKGDTTEESTSVSCAYVEYQRSISLSSADSDVFIGTLGGERRR